MGWVIALVGILLVVVNPMIGIGVFILGVIVVLGSSSSKPSSPETKAVSAVFGLVIGALVVMIGLSAAVGIVGALLAN